MTNIERKTIRILIVEDNPGDVILLKDALSDSNFFGDVTVVPDGAEAMSYLKKIGKYSNVKLPELILLDLNLPKKHGKEVLIECKSDFNLQHIPIVILSVSQAEDDILSCYKLHANCYIVKPMEYESLRKIVSSLEEFWFSTVRLPEKIETI